MLDRARLQEADWVLTTYETLRDYQHSFGAVRWAVVVFDEAQKIKTPGTLMTEAAKAVQAEFTLAMTGTPVENRLADLWCIVDTVQPALLGDLKTFSRTYEQTEDEAVLRELKQKVDHDEPEPPPRPKVLLRRLKGAHLKGLPPKHEHVLKAPMPPVQAERYKRAVGLARGAGGDRESMLKTIHQLRSLSLHPLPPGEGMSDEEYIAASARLAEAIRVLDEVARAGERALVYVDSLEFQSILRGLLQRRYGLAQPPLLINGTVAGDQRKRRVDVFQQGDGFDVMILSPRAGGVGLTLTAATHVIHLSRWWNAAVEDQCTDRVYRIGQERPVHISFPMAIHPVFGEYSFDVQLDNLIRRKRQLSHALLSPGDATEQDLRQLFEATVHQPKDRGTVGQVDVKRLT
ncbi:MAG: DEAD/DEAH box helicase [Limnochordaceae bacterium]|nr:DEAD/DEAH box helicase [Limnochordaceae bacterium]